MTKDYAIHPGRSCPWCKKGMVIRISGVLRHEPSWFCHGCLLQMDLDAQPSLFHVLLSGAERAAARFPDMAVFADLVTHLREDPRYEKDREATPS